MERALRCWANGVRRFAPLVILLSLAATAGIGAWFVGNVRIQTDTEDMLSRNLPFRKLRDEMKAAFPLLRDTILVVVEGSTPDRTQDAALALADRIRAEPEVYGRIFDPRSHPFLRQNGLLFLETEELLDLSDRLAEVQPLLGSLASDPSLRGLATLLARAADAARDGEEPPEELASFLGRAAEAVASANGSFGWRDLLNGSGAGDGPRLIVVSPRLDFESLGPATAALDGLRSLAEELSLTEENGVRVRLSGQAAINHEELMSVKRGLGWAGLASVLLVLTILTLGLRSLRMVVAVLVTLAVGLVWTAGFALATYGALNIISVSFAVLFVGLSVDYGIHFCLRFREEALSGMDLPGALAEAVAGTGGPLFLCALTGVFAFYAFLPTDYVALAQLGFIAGTGLFIGLFANLTVLPALLALLRPVARKTWSSRGPLGGALRLAPRHSKAIAIGAVVVGGLAALVASRVRFDFDPLNLKDPKTESVSTLMELIDNPLAVPYSAELLVGDEREAADAAERLEALPEVRSTRFIGDYVPADQEEKLAIIDDLALTLGPVLAAAGPADTDIDSAQRREAALSLAGSLERLMESAHANEALRAAAGSFRSALAAAAADPARLAAAEARLLGGLPGRLAELRESLSPEGITIESLPAEIRDREVAPDGRTRVSVLPREDLRDSGALRRFVTATRKVAPRITGWPVVLLAGREIVLGAFLQAALTAVVLIAALLLVVLRRPVEVLLVFAPLVLAALLTGAASAVLHMPFNFANIIVLPLLFGLGVDSGIHFVLRVREEGEVGPLLETSTPSAVLLSALTTIGSFASIGLSAHRGMASMGILLAIAITFTLLATLVVLPALLSLRNRGIRATFRP